VNYRAIHNAEARGTACGKVEALLRSSRYHYRPNYDKPVWTQADIVLLRRTIIELANVDTHRSEADLFFGLLYAYGKGVLGGTYIVSSPRTSEDNFRLIRVGHLAAKLSLNYGFGHTYFRDLQKFAFYILESIDDRSIAKRCPWLNGYLAAPMRRMLLDADYCCRFEERRWADVERALRFAIKKNAISAQLAVLASLLLQKIAETHQMFVWDKDIPYYSPLQTQAVGILRFFLEKAEG
jgi:hypothetical protein